jgi:hypothetical protein
LDGAAPLGGTTPKPQQLFKYQTKEIKMKHADLISRSKERSRKMNIRRLLQQAFVLTLAVLLLAGCSGAPAGQQGEIIGITTQISFEEAQSGEIKNMAYAGTVVVLLPDNEEVIANCPEEFLSNIPGVPVFNVDQISGGFVATITVKLEEHQNVLLVRNEADEWEVTKVLK